VAFAFVKLLGADVVGDAAVRKPKKKSRSEAAPPEPKAGLAGVAGGA